MSETSGPDYSLGPEIPVTEHYGLLDYVLNTFTPYTHAVEFGVGEGNSTRLIAGHMPVIGFDSFQGLPEDWREDFPRGTFATTPPAIVHSTLVIGPFEETLPLFPLWAFEIGLVHFDADLYSSTGTALDHLRHVLIDDKPLVVFDEWHNYPGCEDHEQRAWREFVAETGINWTVVGHTHEQWAIRLL